MWNWMRKTAHLYGRTEREEEVDIALVAYGRGKRSIMGIPHCPISLKSLSAKDRKYCSVMSGHRKCSRL